MMPCDNEEIETLVSKLEKGHDLEISAKEAAILLKNLFSYALHLESIVEDMPIP